MSKYIVILLGYDDLNTYLGPFDTEDLAEMYVEMFHSRASYKVEELEAVEL